jgi:hypothetical protein
VQASPLDAQVELLGQLPHIPPQPSGPQDFPEH